MEKLLLYPTGIKRNWHCCKNAWDDYAKGITHESDGCFVFGEIQS
jgi:hypothetical protein